MSEGLAGGDFCATRLPIRITVLLSRCKGKDFFRNRKMKTYDYPEAKQVIVSGDIHGKLREV